MRMDTDVIEVASKPGFKEAPCGLVKRLSATERADEEAGAMLLSFAKSGPELSLYQAMLCLTPGCN
jgi:hypothetical protein